jgi:hypothetical protein
MHCGFSFIRRSKTLGIVGSRFQCFKLIGNPKIWRFAMKWPNVSSYLPHTRSSKPLEVVVEAFGLFWVYLRPFFPHKP